MTFSSHHWTSSSSTKANTRSPLTPTSKPNKLQRPNPANTQHHGPKSSSPRTLATAPSSSVKSHRAPKVPAVEQSVSATYCGYPDYTAPFEYTPSMASSKASMATTSKNGSPTYYSPAPSSKATTPSPSANAYERARQYDRPPPPIPDKDDRYLAQKTPRKSGHRRTVTEDTLPPSLTSSTGSVSDSGEGDWADDYSILDYYGDAGEEVKEHMYDKDHPAGRHHSEDEENWGGFGNPLDVVDAAEPVKLGQGTYGQDHVSSSSREAKNKTKTTTTTSRSKDKDRAKTKAEQAKRTTLVTNNLPLNDDDAYPTGLSPPPRKFHTHDSPTSLAALSPSPRSHQASPRFQRRAHDDNNDDNDPAPPIPSKDSKSSGGGGASAQARAQYVTTQASLHEIEQKKEARRLELQTQHQHQSQNPHQAQHQALMNHFSQSVPCAAPKPPSQPQHSASLSASAAVMSSPPPQYTQHTHRRLASEGSNAFSTTNAMTAPPRGLHTSPSISQLVPPTPPPPLVGYTSLTLPRTVPSSRGKPGERDLSVAGALLGFDITPSRTATPTSTLSSSLASTSSSSPPPLKAAPAATKIEVTNPNFRFRGLDERRGWSSGGESGGAYGGGGGGGGRDVTRMRASAAAHHGERGGGGGALGILHAKKRAVSADHKESRLDTLIRRWL